MHGVADLWGGRIAYTLTHLGPRRLGFAGTWSTPGKSLRVPVKAIIEFGVDLNLTELLGEELPANFVDSIAALLRPVLEKLGSRPTPRKGG